MVQGKYGWELDLITNYGYLIFLGSCRSWGLWNSGLDKEGELN